MTYIGPDCARCDHAARQHAAIGACNAYVYPTGDCTCPGYLAPATGDPFAKVELPDHPPTGDPARDARILSITTPRDPGEESLFERLLRTQVHAVMREEEETVVSPEPAMPPVETRSPGRILGITTPDGLEPGAEWLRRLFLGDRRQSDYALWPLDKRTIIAIDPADVKSKIVSGKMRAGQFEVSMFDLVHERPSVTDWVGDYTRRVLEAEDAVLEPLALIMLYGNGGVHLGLIVERDPSGMLVRAYLAPEGTHPAAEAGTISNVPVSSRWGPRDWNARIAEWDPEA